MINRTYLHDAQQMLAQFQLTLNEADKEIAALYSTVYDQAQEIKKLKETVERYARWMNSNHDAAS